jgi:ABC-type transport system substrate-binding protein
MAKIQLAQVGINLDLHLMSHAIWSDKLARDPKMEWDVGGIGYGFSQDPHLGFNAFVTDSGAAPDGKSLGGYSNPEFDKWIVKAEQAVNEEDQKKCFQEAEKILIRDATYIPVFYLRLLIAWNKKLKGVMTHPDGSIYVSNQWVNMWLEK